MTYTFHDRMWRRWWITSTQTFVTIKQICKIASADSSRPQKVSRRPVTVCSSVVSWLEIAMMLLTKQPSSTQSLERLGQIADYHHLIWRGHDHFIFNEWRHHHLVMMTPIIIIWSWCRLLSWSFHDHVHHLILTGRISWFVVEGHGESKAFLRDWVNNSVCLFWIDKYAALPDLCSD